MYKRMQCWHAMVGKSRRNLLMWASQWQPSSATAPGPALHVYTGSRVVQGEA